MSEKQVALAIQDRNSLESVENYRFEPLPPIRGYPELRWSGKRSFTSTQYYPAQHKETHGPEVDGWRNKIYWGDNLQVMSHLLKEYRGQVKLIYIDPPFDSNADYKKRIAVKGSRVEGVQGAFEDKQYTDIWTNDEYLQFMYERLLLIRELMSEEGSLYLHCDANKSHHIRCLLDEVFGRTNFQNEIVWQRLAARSDATTYNHIHDTLFFFTKTENFIWNQQFAPYTDEYIKSKFSQIDENGRKFQLDNITSPNPRPNMTYVWRGFAPPDNGWRYSRETMQRLHDEGRIWYPDDLSKRPRLKRYLDEQKGRPLQSIWTDIYPVNSQADEREDYPTQKPETLLERIICTSSNPGDLVFDCFMGSGTTQAVAMKLGRCFIGADINLGAVQITTKRLLNVAKELNSQQSKAPAQANLLSDLDDDELSEGPAEPTVFYTGFEVYNVNYYDVFRNPVQARDLLLDALEVNRLSAGHVFDGEKDGRMVKLMPVNRIATRADLNDLLANMDYRAFERRQAEHLNKPVEKITLVCMGHEPDLGAVLESEVKQNGYRIDVEVVDILRDKQELQFKRDAEAKIVARNGQLVIEAFYPMNLLSKLSLQAENVEDWRELVESVMIDWNYDGAVLQPALVDIPDGNTLVMGAYPIPNDAGTIKVKITDLLSESLEVEVAYG